MKEIEKLAALILDEREELLAQWRRQVRELPSARMLDVPTLNDHLPTLIVELADALRSNSEETIAEGLAEASPPAHGLQRFEDGFDIEEVVAEYNILRGCIHDLADRKAITLQGKPFGILNKVFDSAIGLAVKTYATHQAIEVQRRREEYLAFIAHDLRTPLGAISLSTRILELRMPQGNPDPDVERMLRTLRRNVTHLDDLVNHVMKENTHLLTELGVKVERRPFDMWPVVEGLIQDLQPMSSKNATALVNTVDYDLSVRADAGLLRRILQNLIANAIEYTPGGEVRIGARENGPDGAIECWVSDNGAGIPPDRIGSVFEPLQTDPERDGTGLGLAIVKTFVEAHNGYVTVESTEGRGSTFRFTLSQAALENQPAPVKVPEPVKNGA